MARSWTLSQSTIYGKVAFREFQNRWFSMFCIQLFFYFCLTLFSFLLTGYLLTSGDVENALHLPFSLFYIHIRWKFFLWDIEKIDLYKDIQRSLWFEAIFLINFSPRKKVNNLFDAVFRALSNGVFKIVILASLHEKTSSEQLSQFLVDIR